MGLENGEMIQFYDATGGGIQFRQWMKEIDIYAIVYNMDDNEKKKIAMLTAEWPTGEFIRRELERRPDDL